MSEVEVRTVEREIDGETFIVQLHRDMVHEKRNRFEFEGEKYHLIVSRPKPVPVKPTTPEPSTRELILEMRGKVNQILDTLKEVKTI